MSSSVRADATRLERTIERTQEHTFDLRTPPSRKDVGLATGRDTVDYNCNRDCPLYDFTLVLPQGRELALEVRSLYFHSGVGSPDSLPEQATMEVDVERTDVLEVLRAIQQPMGLSEDEVVRGVQLTRGLATDGSGDKMFISLPCIDYLQPSVGFFTSASDASRVRVLVELFWGGGFCGVEPSWS